MRKVGINFDEIERAIDEFFDDILISRWRAARPPQFERAQVLDFPDRYEVRIGMPGVDIKRIEVDINGQRLTIRAPAPENHGVFENSFSFSAPVDSEGVEARCQDQTLIVAVPKQKPKRIKVTDR